MSESDRPLAFDDVLIDLAGHRLVRGGIEQPLEPKAFGVLALLAGTPGRVFSRDEILDAVWGHRHVTPGVLNRAMTLLRHALGEDAQEPRYLHTVHSVGYRFELPVSALSAPAGSALATEPASAPAPMRRAGDGRRGFPRALPWLLPVLAVLAFAGWKLWPRTFSTAGRAVPVVPAAPAKPVATPTIVVLPLKPIGDNESTRTIAEGLSEELIDNLARIDGLRVIARESTRLAAADSYDPAQLARTLGITHSLEGSLQQSGQSLRIHLRLLDASGGALWSKDFDRDATEVLALQRDIAQSVATSLALKLGLATIPAKTGDADFLRRSLAARALVERNDLPPEQSIEVAESEFRALLRERPDDARAHAGLAAALYVRTKRRPSLASVPLLREEALREAAQAQRLDPSLPEPYLIQGDVACNANLWERCLLLRDRARALGSRQDSYLGYAFALAQLGYLDRAEATLRDMIVHDPINTQPHFVHGRVLDTLGRHQDAHREFERHRSPNDVYGRWFNAVWRNDYAEAGRIADAEIGAPGSPDAYGGMLKPGYVAASRALQDPASWPQALTAAQVFEQKTGLMNFIQLLAPDAPDHASLLIHKLGKIRSGGYSSWDLLLWTKDLAWLRRDPAFQDYLRRNGILDYWRKHGFPKQCRPQGDGAYCD